MFSKEDIVTLRKQTGAGLMDCREALQKSGGDIKEAVYYLRKKGLSKAAKKADRTTSEGLVAIAISGDRSRVGGLVMNCETDFVSKNAEFIEVANSITNVLMEKGGESIEQFVDSSLKDGKVSDEITALIAKYGENVVISDIYSSNRDGGAFYSYLHFNRKLGIIVEFDQPVEEEIGKDVAMHIAANNPTYINESEIEGDVVEREKALFQEELKSSNKPPQVMEKIIEGKLKSFYKTVCLIHQDFIKDPSYSVGSYLKGKGNIVSFKRLSL